MNTYSGLLAATLLVLTACGDKGEDEADECYTDDDCAAGLVCVISHDHPGDDHDHGGSCEVPDTATP